MILKTASMTTENAQNRDDEKKNIYFEIRQKIANAKIADQCRGFTWTNSEYVSNTWVFIECVRMHGQCYFCQQPFKLESWSSRDPLQLTIDRLDNNKPHIIENCVLSCWGCNNKRGCNRYVCSPCDETAVQELIQKFLTCTGLRSLTDTETEISEERYREANFLSWIPEIYSVLHRKHVSDSQNCHDNQKILNALNALLEHCSWMKIIQTRKSLYDNKKETKMKVFKLVRNPAKKIKLVMKNNT